MPSIWITSKSSPERSDASHFFMCTAESATKRRETADFDRPEPAGDGTSPSGRRTERLNLRVDTLIDDGKLEAKVESVEAWGLLARVTAVAEKGLRLKPERGLNFPDCELEI